MDVYLGAACCDLYKVIVVWAKMGIGGLEEN